MEEKKRPFPDEHIPPVEKPPLGIKPREVCAAERLQVVRDVIHRYTKSGCPGNPEWLVEYFGLTEYLREIEERQEVAYVQGKEAMKRFREIFKPKKQRSENDARDNEIQGTEKVSEEKDPGAECNTCRGCPSLCDRQDCSDRV